MDNYNFISVTIHQGAVNLHLNRADKKNAFHAEMIHEITNAMHLISSKQSLRFVTITAEGNCFSAGADLNYMKSMTTFSKADNEKDSLALFDLFLSVYDCPLPVICLVNGPCYGGANGIIAAADFVIATTTSAFRFSEVNLGIIPATISPFIISKIGIANCRDVFLSGRKLNAHEAKSIGLVNQVVDPTDAKSSLEEYKNELFASAPNAVRKTKQLIRSFAPLKPAEYRTQTAELIAQARVSEEGQEGLKSFFEKRKPFWNS